MEPTFVNDRCFVYTVNQGKGRTFTVRVNFEETVNETDKATVNKAMGDACTVVEGEWKE